MPSSIASCQPYGLLDRNRIISNSMTVLSGRKISKHKPLSTDPAPLTSFRLLDLPTEIRLLIYESIAFPSTSHILDKAHGLIKKRHYMRPDRSQGQIHDSRMNMNRPRFPIEILLTCRLVYKEARTILQRKAEPVRVQPLRLTFDYSLAWEFLYPAGPFKTCCGMPDAVKDLSRVWRKLTAGVQTIEFTLTHRRDVAYGREIVEAMVWLREFTIFPTRIRVIYKAALPGTRVDRKSPSSDPGELERLWLRDAAKENGVGDEPAQSVGCS